MPSFPPIAPILLIVALMVALLAGASPLPAIAEPNAEASRDESDVFSGVIESIDRKTMEMTVITDIGRAVPFSVRNPDLIADLQPGERVSVELDDHHEAAKITRMAPPELPTPPAGGS